MNDKFVPKVVPTQTPYRHTLKSSVSTLVGTGFPIPWSPTLTSLPRYSLGDGQSTMAAPEIRPRGQSAMPSLPSWADASQQTPLRPMAGRPTKEATFLARPLALPRLVKARRQDAALPIPRPPHHRPLVHRGDGQPAGTAGQAGREAAGLRAVGGNDCFWQRISQHPIGCVCGSPRVCRLPSFFCHFKVIVNI